MKKISLSLMVCGVVALNASAGCTYAEIKADGVITHEEKLCFLGFDPDKKGASAEYKYQVQQQLEAAFDPISKELEEQNKNEVINSGNAYTTTTDDIVPSVSYNGMINSDIKCFIADELGNKCIKPTDLQMAYGDYEVPAKEKLPNEVTSVVFNDSKAEDFGCLPGEECELYVGTVTDYFSKPELPGQSNNIVFSVKDVEKIVKTTLDACKKNPQKCGIETGIGSKITNINEVASKVSYKTFKYAGVYVHFGKGSYDWLYVMPQGQVFKLEEGVTKDKNLRWTPVSSIIGVIDSEDGAVYFQER